MTQNEDLKTIEDEGAAFKILTSSRYDYQKNLSTIEATDEIITIFCRLHGGLEEAMPIIRNQFKKASVDFSEPSKDGLKAVVNYLVDVTSFIKGKRMADLEKKRFEHIIKCIGTNSETAKYA